MAEYNITFEPGSPIWNLYKKMGVPDSKLDEGSPKTDYTHKKRATEGKRDKKIQKEEVLGYAAEREEYYAALKETTGYEIPWALNDLELRDRIGKAIIFFEEKLVKAGFKKGTDRYNELLGVSLFTFAMASKKNPFAVKFPKNVMSELEAARLKAVINYVGENGGLGLIDIKNDCEIEATAEEALNKSCGECTEMSKILYAVFKLAGLNARFAHVIPNQRFTKEFKKENSYRHISVALKLGRRTRVFDASLELSNTRAYYDRYVRFWFEQTNREFLSVHYLNLGTSHHDNGNLYLAERFYKIAIEINSSLPEAYYNLAGTYHQKGKIELAVTEYNKAIKFNPDLVDAQFNLGVIRNNRGEYEAATFHMKRAIEIDPNYAKAHYMLGTIYTKLGNILREEGKPAGVLKMYRKALAELEIAHKLGDKNAKDYSDKLQKMIELLGQKK